jgi:hypothetical protein
MQNEHLPNSPQNGGHFSELLKSFSASLPGETANIGMIIHFMGDRSFGALLLVLALPMALPIPAPGISVAFGIPLILISAQLLLGRRHAWLPARLDTHTITRKELESFVAYAVPKLCILESIARPRVHWMTQDWILRLTGAVCLLLALIITLPIPFGHMVPGAAISLLALGLIEHDGLAMALGLIVSLLALIVVTIASFSIATALYRWIIA